jgi:glycerol-3-phosphate acyltransferase PlsY
MILTVACILVAYLIGAIPFGLLIARVFGVRDIRQAGSGNIGATNVVRVLGFKAAVWVYLLDIGKGVAAVLLARLVPDPAYSRDLFLVVVALAAILGHIFPLYLRFKGGKGVSTAFGCLIVLMPIPALLAAAAFFIIAFTTRFISLASMIGAIVLPVVVIVRQEVFGHPVSPVYWGLALAVGVLVPITHRQNIKRLVHGTESRFSLSSRSGGGGSHV